MKSGANGERRRGKAADQAKRRLKTLRALGEHMAENAAEACAAAAAVLGQNDDDLPFALVYLLDRDGGRARLAGRAGMPEGTAACPLEVDLGGHEAWPFSAVLAAGAAQLVEDLAERFGPLPGGPWPEPAARAMVLPLARAGEGRLWGFVILGVSPRLAFDDEDRDFFHLIAGQVATAIANAQALRRDLAALNRQLHERAAELETLLNVIPVGIGVALDPLCSRIQVNPAFASVLGLSAGANASKTAPSGERPRGFRVVGDDGREIPDDQLPMQVSAREGREVREAEFDIVHADGRVVRLLEYAAPLFDEAGQPRGSVGAFVDITDRRRVEARDRFLLALDDATRPLTEADAIMAACTELLGKHLAVDRCTYAEVHADLDTIDLPFNYVNDVPSMVGRYRLADFGDEVVRRYRAGELVLVDDIEASEPPVPDLAAYRQLQIRAGIGWPLHKAGRLAAAFAVHQKVPRHWTPAEIELVRLVGDRCWESIERARIARALQDSEREALAESESRFRQLANSIPQLAWMARPDGHIFWYNDRWYEYTGTTAESQQGWGWESVHDPAELPRVLVSWQAALAAEEPWEDSFPLRRHDGELRWHLSRARPLGGAEGSVVLWFGTNTDIEDERRGNDERERLLDAERFARAEAERVGRIKDEFLATLSHELRTPLNAILGWAHLLGRTPVPDNVRKGLDAIGRNAQAQAQLIEDLLDMSRIISGKVKLDVGQVALPDVIAAALDVVRPSADAKQIRLQTTLDPTAGPVSGDPNRLQQVLWNLLHNAVKFTSAGGSVHVALERVAGHAEVSITDTGQGIRPEFLPFVFERFRQADASTTRLHSGLGLGLAIVKHLVELHGGSVRVISRGENEGSTFFVALPLPAAGAGPGEAAARQASTTVPPAAEELPPFCQEPVLRGVTALVVDDDADSRELLKFLLEECAAQVVLAASAAEAMARLEEAVPDILISDIGMPGVDGYELIRRVRQLDRGDTIPAIALTAFARSEDRQRALRAGYQMHVAKPVEPAELVAVVESLTGKPRPPEDTPES